MSILKVDTINEKTTGNGVQIAGHVVQVLSANLGADHSYSSSSTAETNILTLNITPKFSTSKVLVLCNFGLYINSSAAESRGNLGIERDSTVIRGNDSASGVAFFRDSSGHFKSYMTGFNFLDSPSTTSSVEYRIDGKVNNASVHRSTYQNEGSDSTLTLLEIGA